MKNTGRYSHLSPKILVASKYYFSMRHCRALGKAEDIQIARHSLQTGTSHSLRPQARSFAFEPLSPICAMKAIPTLQG